MIHEPECPNQPEHFVPEDSILWSAVCHCDTIRTAYQRGREDAAQQVHTELLAQFRGVEHAGHRAVVAAARGDLHVDDKRKDNANNFTHHTNGGEQ